MSDRERVEEILRDVLADCMNADEPMQEQAEIECGVERLLAILVEKQEADHE
jgi:hypothetical protein